MALFADIPMPDVHKGWSEFAEIMMKNKQNKSAMEQKKAEEAERIREFNKQFQLSQSAEGRAQDLHKYALSKAQQEQDINEYFNRIIQGNKNQPNKNASTSQDTSMINGMINPQQAPQSNNTPFAPNPNAMNMPAKDVINIANNRPQTPQGQQPNQQSPSGSNLDLLKQNPMLRGLFKHKFGFDPFEKTPEEKRADELKLYKDKLALQAEAKDAQSGETLTNSTLTKNQQSIQAIDQVLPILDDLINSKDLPGILSFGAGKKAAYTAKTGGAIEKLITSQGLAKDQESTKLVISQIRRDTNETIHDYKNRLRDLKKMLLQTREIDKDSIKNKKINLTDPLNGEEIIIIDSNGDEHSILPANLEEAKKRDPGLKVKKGVGND